MWIHCVENTRQLDGLLDYKHVELGKFDDYNTNSNSSNDSDIVSPYPLPPKACKITDGNQFLKKN